MVKTSVNTIRPIGGGCLKRRLLFKRVRPTESVPPQHDDVCPKGTWGRGGGLLLFGHKLTGAKGLQNLQTSRKLMSMMGLGLYRIRTTKAPQTCILWSKYTIPQIYRYPEYRI